MPKLIDYPRTTYTSAWEVAEVVDDTGGKCALETCARKLNRKVSGSFKAIVGSAVKFGLLTSKREVLATTTLFRRIKHAYDKQEELLFHREAFLTPPLFTQLCRKFRSRELPVAMLDVLLMREFGVEEINTQSVAKAFIDGARMVNLLDENNVIADIDQLAAHQAPRRELASPTPAANVFRQLPTPTVAEEDEDQQISPDTNDTSQEQTEKDTDTTETTRESTRPKATEPTPAPPARAASRAASLPPSRPAPAATTDAIASLFGLGEPEKSSQTPPATKPNNSPSPPLPPTAAATTFTAQAIPATAATTSSPRALFHMQLTGPGINTELEVTDIEDLALVRALLDKIERQLKK